MKKYKIIILTGAFLLSVCSALSARESSYSGNNKKEIDVIRLVAHLSDYIHSSSTLGYFIEKIPLSEARKKEVLNFSSQLDIQNSKYSSRLIKSGGTEVVFQNDFALDLQGINQGLIKIQGNEIKIKSGQSFKELLLSINEAGKKKKSYSFNLIPSAFATDIETIESTKLMFEGLKGINRVIATVGVLSAWEKVVENKCGPFSAEDKKEIAAGRMLMDIETALSAGSPHIAAVCTRRVLADSGSTTKKNAAKTADDVDGIARAQEGQRAD